MNSIILTGASRGLGRELHKLLALDELPFGQRIFITRKPLAEAHASHLYIQADLEQLDDLNISLDIAPDSKVVVFINNAGTIEPIGKAVDVSALSIESALRINCLGPLSLAQQLAVETREIGARLFILNVSSGAARRPIKGWMGYCVSKAAAVMAFDVLAAENDHVEVLHFDPGVMDTDMQSHIRQQSAEIMPDVEIFRGFKADYALKTPQEVAEQIVSIVRSVIR
ncbi:SDR family NAD(P)-dependent oxidoreductase [Pseudomonas alcaligenes]|jgi:short-subunit dehydrogenase|uniref:SDR family NAD(P)-dependent oxidoreductase n=1 Tax=Pseudomonadaceae TaxID=135621 RepID=UPI0014748C78|nr:MULTISPECIES: SDR family NAD(P)-dependent oxidoreductase [Pseudomonas]MEE1949595.1 SDR family NAD(P)-dependent oxidoreductase [Pseudomonas alcaligenes]NMY40036.1 SDR family NAD(P)-dependent oxidoreductase [Pseudomonas sp. WS 5013]